MPNFEFRGESWNSRPGCVTYYCIIIAIVAGWVAATLFLGIASIVIAVEGNRDPSVAASTPCPALNSSMMPSTYKMTWSRNYHARIFLQPVQSLNIVAEQRCFNYGRGSSLLWVNDELAAFSEMNGMDQTIFDCHGQRLYRVCLTCWIDKQRKAKVYTDDGTYIWASDLPSSPSRFKKGQADPGAQIVYGQPEDLVVASVSRDESSSSSANVFTIFNPQSPAADPRLLVMM